MTKRKATPHEVAQWIAFLALSAGTDGTSMRDIRQETGQSETCVGNWLAILRELGVIEPSANFGSRVKWGPPGTWDHYAAWREKGLRERTRRATLADEQRRCIDAGDQPFLRVVHHVSECAPIIKTGPASVWELAA